VLKEERVLINPPRGSLGQDGRNTAERKFSIASSGAISSAASKDKRLEEKRNQKNGGTEEGRSAHFVTDHGEGEGVSGDGGVNRGLASTEPRTIKVGGCDSLPALLARPGRMTEE